MCSQLGNARRTRMRNRVPGPTARVLPAALHDSAFASPQWFVLHGARWQIRSHCLKQSKAAKGDLSVASTHFLIGPLAMVTLAAKNIAVTNSEQLIA